MSGEHEKKFLQELAALFAGAKTEGDSGFVNLMRVKNSYFEEIRPLLMGKISEAVGDNAAFREELFEKLHAFFSRYFCDSGSVYFRHVPSYYPALESAYADGGDIELVWKTRDLYYVKSDRIVVSMPVEWQTESGRGHRFYFDTSGMEHKKNNERRDFIYEYAGKDDDSRLKLKVSLAKGGIKTKVDTIIKDARKDGIQTSEDDLTRAFAVFTRQTEADFFIHKNASKFLQEQFNLWMYQYVFHEENTFSEKRMAQLNGLRDVATNLINFIGQFEDELVRVWQKQKFVRNANYVVTVDKLTPEVLKKLTKHTGAKKQTEEWQELGLVLEDFKVADILTNDTHKFLPVDTCYFKDMEDDILACLGDLDTALNGELVKSENWQALNVLQQKYAGRVKCIYIDPPFNLDSSDQFAYRTNYKNANWATMLENRLTLARDFLSDDGAIFVRCDYNGNWIVRCLLDKIFGADNLGNEIIINRTRARQTSDSGFMQKTESLFFYLKTKQVKINEIRREITEKKWHSLLHFPRHNPSPRTILGKDFYPPRNRRWALSQERIDKFIKLKNVRINKEDSYIDCRGETIKGMPELYYDFEEVGNEWLDIKSYSQSNDFSTENSEEILMRVILSSSGEDSITFDFFSGSGTTQAVAQKLGRKWLGVEMGEHFDTVILPRLKKVLAGHKSGISKQTDYKGGGAFVYYALEQYEETLKNMRYKEGDLIEAALNKTPFAQYVFLTDDKFAHAIKIKGKGEKRKLEINLSTLYKDIALAETLANLRGSPIRKKNKDAVTLANGETFKTNLDNLMEDEKMELIKILKPCLWWGE